MGAMHEMYKKFAMKFIATTTYHLHSNVMKCAIKINEFS